MKQLNQQLIADYFLELKQKKQPKKPILIIGGCEKAGGTALLAAQACIQSGAGVTTVAVSQNIRASIRHALPECHTLSFMDTPDLLVALKKADIILIGPGLGLDKFAKTVFEAICEHLTEHQTLILDDDAIALYSLLEPRLLTKKVIITPNASTWRHLAKHKSRKHTPISLRIEQKRLKAVIVLKEKQLIICSGDDVYFNEMTCSNGFSNDIPDSLAGLITGLCSQLRCPLRASLLATYLYTNLTNELTRTQQTVRPSDLNAALSRFMKKMSNTSILSPKKHR